MKDSWIWLNSGCQQWEPDVAAGNGSKDYIVLFRVQTAAVEAARLLKNEGLLTRVKDVHPGAVAQLARAIALQAIGCGFDPRQLHQDTRAYSSAG